ncbi:MAG TPA: NTP transferase domain-containing protein [Thermodesulfovibrionales bacterium]|nr:NTP transferase domain-containing protein [Thermodesulfovibrionales bacterium]
MNLSCVILAAGLGKRMKSSLPKVLHRVCGTPMLQSVINTTGGLKPDKLIVVVGEQMELIKRTVKGEGVIYAFQETPRGTGHALRSAIPALNGFKGIVLVVNGDTPLLGGETLRKFLKLHVKDKNAISVLSFRAGNPDNYGRIVRDASGRVVSIIEHKDADSLGKKIPEVNSGVYAINHDALRLLDEIKINAAKGEYYLTDIIARASKKGLKIAAYCMGTEEEFMGVNTREELHRASMLVKNNCSMAGAKAGSGCFAEGKKSSRSRQ